jgi:hypothetical protein
MDEIVKAVQAAGPHVILLGNETRTETMTSLRGTADMLSIIKMVGREAIPLLTALTESNTKTVSVKAEAEQQASVLNH